MFMHSSLLLLLYESYCVGLLLSQDTQLWECSQLHLFNALKLQCLLSSWWNHMKNFNCKEMEYNYNIMWLGEENKNKLLLISGHISQLRKLLIIDIVAVTWQVLFSASKMISLCQALITEAHMSVCSICVFFSECLDYCFVVLMT